MKTSNVILTVLALFAVTAFALGLREDLSRVDGGVVRIGFIGPLSGSGGVFGLELKHAALMALDEVNAGSAMQGKRLELLFEDGKCDGKTAVNAAQKLIVVDKVQIILATCSAEVLAVAPVAEKAHVLLVGMWTTHADVTNAGDYVFRVSYSDALVGETMGKVLAQKYAHIGLLSETTSYPAGVSLQLHKYYEGRIDEETFLSESYDLRTPVAKVLAEKPQAILLNPNTPTTAVALLQTLARAGYSGPLYGNVLFAANEVRQQSNAENLVYFADPVPNGPQSGEFFARYKSRFAQMPDFTFGAGTAYDAVHVVAEAVAQVGDDATALKTYLYHMPDHDGVIGRYHFDSNGDATGMKIQVLRIRGGATELVPGEQ